MAIELLIDSVILIDHLNGLSVASDFLRDNWHRSAVSVVSRTEILAGYGVKEQREVLRLLNRFPALGIGLETADLACRLRLHNGWRVPDAFQAAIAQANKLQFVTRNTRDFPAESHSFVMVPYTL